jgi:HEAT repeat protein
MTAQDWDDLTNLLACHPTIILSPRRIWTDLAERLLYETSIADGILWMRRSEAFNRLIAHPAGQHAAISTVASAAADRSVQSMVGTVSVFEASVHDTASTHVIRHLTDPMTDRTFYGALLASVRKLRYGHFTPTHLRKLVPVIVDILAEGRSGARLSLAAALLKMLPVEMRQRVNDRIWGMATENLEQTPAVTRTVDRLHNATVAGLEATPRFNDAVLPQLIQELLFDPIFDVRLYAAFLLYSTPYRQPLGRALNQELLSIRSTARQTVTLLEALRILGGPEERPHIERLLVAPGVPNPVRDTAASALGHVGGSSTDGYWRSALRTARQRWRQTQAKAEISVLDRVVYALGMAGQQALLRAVTADASLPSRIRSAANWWTTLPRHIQDSARS